MASLSMRANAAIFRPAAAAGRRQALRAPAGLGGMLPLRRASTVRVASASSRRLSVSAVSTPIRPEPLERVRNLGSVVRLTLLLCRSPAGRTVE